MRAVGPVLALIRIRSGPSNHFADASILSSGCQRNNHSLKGKHPPDFQSPKFFYIVLDRPSIGPYSKKLESTAQLHILYKNILL